MLVEVRIGTVLFIKKLNDVGRSSDDRRLTDR